MVNQLKKHLPGLAKIVGELKAIGKTYLVVDQITRIIENIPLKCLSKVVAITSMNFNNITYDEVKGDIIAFERLT